VELRDRLDVLTVARRYSTTTCWKPLIKTTTDHAKNTPAACPLDSPNIDAPIGRDGRQDDVLKTRSIAALMSTSGAR
jgi:hypothetical protein